MKKKIIRISFLALASAMVIFLISATREGAPGDQLTKKPIYLNTAYSFQERAADLVSRMTPEEKQSQLGNTMPPIPRLGVNFYDVWGEALHGVLGRTRNSGMTSTSFPNSVAVGSAWDPELLKRETTVISDEARGFSYNYIFTLTYWSPVVEPARDPRWGRTGESFGEDPFLVSRIAEGFVQGLMGDDPVYLKAVPCGKHYFANNSEFNRHTGSSDMDNRDMREFYLLPYRTLIEKDKLPAIMTCYNAVNGVPMSADKYLVDTIARKTYGLDGYITGDCGAISDIFSGHRYSENYVEAAAMGLKSGVDTDCGSVYQTYALDAVKQGLITEADIDRALVNIFTIRMRLGEFDPKNIVPYAGIRPDIINDPSHNDLAIEVATKTPVLLKNNMVAATGRKALPLKADEIKKIAVIGPQAERVELGPYSGEVEDSLKVTPLAGIKNYIAKNNLKTEVVYSSGGNTVKRSDFFAINGFSVVKSDGSVRQYDATAFDASAKGVIASERMGQKSVRGIKDGDWTSYNNIDITGADSMRINLSVTGADGGIIEARLGSVTGNMIATVKLPGPQQGGFMGFGRTRTAAFKLNTLGITGPQTVVLVYRAPEIAEIDRETISMAASSDVAIVFVGTDETTAREEMDRLTLQLPGNQYELIKSVAAANPNTVVVMQSLGMVEVDQFKDNPNVAGIIWTGFNGQAQGTAMARILFGDANPGGKLNATWYRSVNDLPDIADYNLRGTKDRNGRTYWYFSKDVSYEFGYGLSYTTFEYSNFSISRNNITPNDKITISADVKNTGGVDGDEVVQIYVKTPDSPASLERPIKRLKGFRRVTIPAGQTKTVSVNIDCADLWFWDGKNNRITFDQGRYIFEIGSSSKDIRGQVEAVMSGTYTPVLRTVVAECGKVVLRPGDNAQTSVTASMSDDSFFKISDAKVIYKSNNPAVASVDDKGLVTAKGVGTASIFAYVTVNGKTLSDSYPLKVMPDLNPAFISVNKKNVPGFKPSVKTYSYLLKDDSKVPEVKAAAAGSDVTVSTDQASGIPGTAVVTLTDKITVEKNQYFINFGTRSVSDEFNSGVLGSQWHWVRENSTTWSLSEKPGSLVVTSEKGDIVSSNNNARNILLQNANTDWTIESKVTFSRRPSGFAQNGGILAYQDDDNFVRLAYRADFGRRFFSAGGEQAGSLELVVEKEGYQRTAATLSMAGIIKDDNTLFLKLEKKGSIYTAYCSPDGKKYREIGTADIIMKNVLAGMIVCDGSDQDIPSFMRNQVSEQKQGDFKVSYDYFRITNSGLK
jgi:beta-glucosidase-like glycosyl hydrolase